MNTPAHVIVNLLCLGRKDTVSTLAPVITGSLLPDAAMFVFYFIEKVVRRTPETLIWRVTFYQDNWQNLFAIFNSLPLALLGLGLSFLLQSSVACLFFTSMILHILGDLPLHHDDAHRHFVPFSNWRFRSPISYWDPRHYGGIVTVIEIVVVIGSCIALWLIYKSLLGKISVGLVAASYLIYAIYVLLVWA